MGSTLEAKSLRKAVVPSALLDNPSPGSLQSTRLALHVNEDAFSCWVYIASGCNIYKLQIPLEDSWLSTGKEGLLIPERTKVMNSLLLKRCPHRSEIQSIVLAETESAAYLVLASVDAYGHLIVSKLDASGKDVDKVTYSVLPRDFGVGEGSWSGVCFSPIQWSMAAVAQSFCKSVDVYDQDIHLRTLPACESLLRKTHIYFLDLYGGLPTYKVCFCTLPDGPIAVCRMLWHPSSLNFMRNLGNGDENSILAVTEGCQLSVWDLRMKENGGCLNRICGSVGNTLYAVCSSSIGYIAVAGADRTVTIYDPRRWSALSRWVHCSKYEITGLAFSSLDSDYLYVQGVDYEVFCGQWQESSKVFSFRGDSNWLGFSKVI
ncbi:uncharacterized protein LOC120204672 isoform X2 [Hibiscus syriacus]|uniref:uncharacterized protein LOC120204672 isoform X2 n=1 Tax=Hibiscus syriacus TaxID=106335 RepID=UPI001923D338|nr:uncharacterized protein LOC120204672 isoform X2 [Hibiscus syriacus]